jgi:HrpA-like RNA helicase
MLPVEPKLGKMLIFGAIFNCLDPILTIVSGLSVRDPFLTPFDKKDVSICRFDTPIFVCVFCMHSNIIFFIVTLFLYQCK